MLASLKWKSCLICNLLVIYMLMLLDEMWLTALPAQIYYCRHGNIKATYTVYAHDLAPHSWPCVWNRFRSLHSRQCVCVCMRTRVLICVCVCVYGTGWSAGSVQADRGSVGRPGQVGLCSAARVAKRQRAGRPWVQNHFLTSRQPAAKSEHTRYARLRFSIWLCVYVCGFHNLKWIWLSLKKPIEFEL